MLSNAKKILYLCLDSRKRFLTDPVFTKSRNNWFSTRSVYPLFCSLRPPFPSYGIGEARCPGQRVSPRGAAPWGRRVGWMLPVTGGCVSTEAGSGGKRLLPSGGVVPGCRTTGPPKLLQAGSILGSTACLSEAFLSEAKKAVGTITTG